MAALHNTGGEKFGNYCGTAEVAVGNDDSLRVMLANLGNIAACATRV